MKGSKAEIIRLIKKAVERNDNFINSCEKNPNPQIFEMVQRARGERAAYENLLIALTEKNLISLRIAAGL